MCKSYQLRYPCGCSDPEQVSWEACPNAVDRGRRCEAVMGHFRKVEAPYPFYEHHRNSERTWPRQAPKPAPVLLTSNNSNFRGVPVARPQPPTVIPQVHYPMTRTQRGMTQPVVRQAVDDRWRQNQPDYSGHGYGALSPRSLPPVRQGSVAQWATPTQHRQWIDVPSREIDRDIANAMVGGSLHGPMSPSDSLQNSWLNSPVQTDAQGNLIRADHRATLPSQSDIRSLPSQRRNRAGTNITQRPTVARNATVPARPDLRESQEQSTPRQLSSPQLPRGHPTSDAERMTRYRYHSSPYGYAAPNPRTHPDGSAFMDRIIGELAKIEITGEEPRTVTEKYDFRKADRDSGL